MNTPFVARSEGLWAEPPALARQLGYAGLIPFVLGAGLVWFVRADAHPYVTQGLASYAAVIVSFLGGVHWGLAMPMQAPAGAPRSFRWAMVPPLVSWLAVLMPPAAGLVVLGAMLVATYLVDRRVYAAAGQAHWLTLRFRLSMVAALSCFLGAAGALPGAGT
jgi:hypothetical protein